MMKFEDQLARAMALSVVPIEELEKRTRERGLKAQVTSGGGGFGAFGKKPEKKDNEDDETSEKNRTEEGGTGEEGKSLSFKDAFIVELLKWFKEEFFSWCDKPECCVEMCTFSKINDKTTTTTTTTTTNKTVRTNPANMQCVGMGYPNGEERSFGASMVELYACTGCGCQTRFPRYNEAVKLLETRTGRCGEFANCFSLICRALDYETRYVLDWTDHVWTEIWSPSQNRWIHCDSCEAAFDEPRLYSEGWGKSLSFVVAFSVDGVADVSKRYQKMDDAMVGRRRAIVHDEAFVSEAIARCSDVLETGMDVARRELVRKRNEEEQEELRMLDMSEEEKKNLPGRTTGSLEWRKARGELGDQK